MKSTAIIAVLTLIVTTSTQAYDIGVGVKAGTLGAGVDFSIALTPTVNARLALTSVNTDFDETLEISDDKNTVDVDANINLDFGATALLLDWYVFEGVFHISGGLIKNNSTIDLVGTITSPNVEFDGASYSVSDFVDPTMTGQINMGNSLQPYLGIGWGRKADDKPGLSMSVELGVVMMDPKVDLQAPKFSNEALLNDPNLDQAKLDREVQAAESSANDELSALEFWPVLSIGLNYAF
jgi:hypothetical protein